LTTYTNLSRRQFIELCRVMTDYSGLMSDEQISEEFGFPLDRIRRWKTHKRTKKESICWYCKYACDARKCVYVASCIGYGRYPKYYPGTEVSRTGRVLSCPHFKEG